jgi:MFS family permease
MITPGLPILAKKFSVSMDRMSAFMLGAHQFSAGFAMVVVAAAAAIHGKRPFYVISALILLLTCVWGYWAKSFPSLAAMRIIQGLATAPVETLVTPTVADLFFVHQRGSRIAVWHMMVGGGVGIGQVLAGFIIKYLGVLSTFGVSALVLVLLVPATFFVVLETTYARPKDAWDVRDPVREKEDKDVDAEAHPHALARSPSVASSESESESDLVKKPHVVIESFEPITTISSSPPKPASYRSRLALISHTRYSTTPFWQLLVKPLPLLLFPAVLYSTIVNGFHLASLVAMGLLGLNILTAPPYNLDPAQIGLTHLPNLVAIFVASPIAGFFADWLVKVLARRNRGIFEPEFRLLLMLISVPISTVAFVGFGYAAQAHKPLPIILLFGGLQAVSVPFASQAALTYVLDCHPRDTNSAFVAIHFAKTFFVFVATSTVSGWLARSGPVRVFNTLAAVNLVVSSLTIPAYVFGKRFRSYIARSKMARKIECD